MKLIHAVIILALASISCVTPAALPASRAYLAPELGAAPVPVWETTVTAERLNVRDDPGGDIVSYRLGGDNIVVYAYALIGNYRWCRFTPDGRPQLWLACEWLQ